MDDVKRCCVAGCFRIGHYNSKNKDTGKIYRSKWCTKHHKIHYKMRVKTGSLSKAAEFGKELKRKYKNTCSLCGWVGPCDVHRKVPETLGGRYTEENSMLICPNCHRLQHPEIFPMY